MYDTIIIGGGPAGCAAAVYAARKRLKTLVITEDFGGQSIVSDDIQNWIGESHVSGFDLAKKLEGHVRSFPEVEVKTKELAVKINAADCRDGNKGCIFEVETNRAGKYSGKTIILAAGARHRKLGVPGEEEFNGRGVAYCSTCDAPIFAGKKVAVVGGGNSGLEAVQDLIPYAEEIYLLEYADKLKGDPVTQEEIKKSSKLKQIILKAQTLKVSGDKFMNGLWYKNLQTGEEKELKVEGVFVEIGAVPNSEMVKNLVELDKWGQVKIDSKHASTSHPGIFAAGDITDDPFKQNNISAGDGVKAALSAYAYILQNK